MATAEAALEVIPAGMGKNLNAGSLKGSSRSREFKGIGPACFSGTTFPGI